MFGFKGKSPLFSFFRSIQESLLSRKFKKAARKKILKENPLASDLDVAKALVKEANELLARQSTVLANNLDQALSSYSEMADNVLRHPGIKPENVENLLSVFMDFRENLLKASKDERLAPSKGATDNALKRYDELILRLQKRIQVMREFRRD